VFLVCSHDDHENSSLQDVESVRSGGVRESVIGRPGGIFFPLDDIFFQLDDDQHANDPIQLLLPSNRGRLPSFWLCPPLPTAGNVACTFQAVAQFYSKRHQFE
jgi:hypothetical protein